MTEAGIDRAALQAAWESIYLRDLRDDVLSLGVRGFARDAENRLDRLDASLRDGSWRPGVLSPVDIPKPAGGIRTLHIPTDLANGKVASSA